MKDFSLKAKLSRLKIFCFSKPSQFARAGILLSLINVLVGCLSYVFQILMGRMLSPSEFALFSAFIALIMFGASPLNAIFMILSRKFSTLRALGNAEAKRMLYWRSHATIVIIAIPIFIFLWLVEDGLRVWLKFPNQSLIWLLAIALFFMALLVVSNAFLQGDQLFGILAAVSIVFALLKILFGVAGVYFFHGAEAALTGLIIAYGVTLGGAVFLCKQKIIFLQTFKLQKSMSLTWKSVWPVLFANFAFAMMTQLDMVLVNWYFTAEEAGQYAAASVLGKAVLYLPGGLVLAMYPMVAENHVRNFSSAPLLKQAVTYTIFLCGLAALTYWFIGEWLVLQFFGESYKVAGNLVRWYGFAIFPMALVMIAEYFLIAKARILFVWLFMLIAPLQLVAINVWHDSLIGIIGIMALGGSILVFVGYMLLYLEYRSIKK